MRQIALFLSLLLLAPLADLVAQDAPSLAPGARVRVTTSTFNRITWSRNEEIRVGTLVALSADTLTFRTGERNALTSIPLTSVNRLDMSLGKGKRNTLKGVRIGLLIGASMGAMWGFMAMHEEKMFGALVGTGLLGASGAAVGALTGSQIAGDQWERVPLPVRVSISPQRHGGVRLAASFAF